MNIFKYLPVLILLWGCSSDNNLSITNSGDSNLSIHFRGSVISLAPSQSTSISSIPNGTFSYSTVVTIPEKILVTEYDTINEGSIVTPPGVAPEDIDTIKVVPDSDPDMPTRIYVSWTQESGIDSTVLVNTDGELQFQNNISSVTMEYSSRSKTDKLGKSLYYIEVTTNSSVSTEDPISKIIK